MGLCFEMEINNKIFDILTSNSRLWYLEEVRSRGQPFNRKDSWRGEVQIRDPQLQFGPVLHLRQCIQSYTREEAAVFCIQGRLSLDSLQCIPP